jgi:hypothetical protein
MMGTFAALESRSLLELPHQDLTFGRFSTVSTIRRAKGFEGSPPLYSAAHRWKDRSKEFLLPLFPCYVFFRGGLERRMARNYPSEKELLSRLERFTCG